MFGSGADVKRARNRRPAGQGKEERARKSGGFALPMGVHYQRLEMT
jgi:hypothetical protein